MSIARPKPWKQEFIRWVPVFIDNVKSSAAARRVWRTIQDARFPGQAALLLYFYSLDEEVTFGKMHARANENVRLLKAAIRIEERESKYPPKSPQSTGPARMPAVVACKRAFASEWAGRSGESLGKVFARLRRDTGRNPSLGDARTIVVMSTGRQSIFKATYHLIMLQEYPAIHGLMKLGYKRLAILAHCACPSKLRTQTQVRELARWLQSVSPDQRQNIRQDMLSEDIWRVWPSTPFRRSEFPALFGQLRTK